MRLFFLFLSLYKRREIHTETLAVSRTAPSQLKMCSHLCSFVHMLAKKTVDRMEFKNLMTLCWGCIPLVALCSVLCLIKEE